MKTIGRRMGGAYWISGLAIASSLSAVACGGSSGGSSPDGKKWVCQGSYDKLNSDGSPVLDANGNNISQHTLSPNRSCAVNTEHPNDPFACVCLNKDTQADQAGYAAAKDKCVSELTKWEKAQASTQFTYQWNITSATIADPTSGADCNVVNDSDNVLHIMLVGGLSQYSCNLKGALGLRVSYSYSVPWPPFTEHGSASSGSDVNAVMEYNVTGGVLGACPAGGCGLTIQRFTGYADDFSIRGTSVTGIRFQNESTILGKVQNDGSFATTSGWGDLSFFYTADGTSSTILKNLSQPITGRISPDGKSMSIDSFSVSQDSATVSLTGLTGTAFVSPPAVSFTPTGDVECQSPSGSLVSFDGSATTGGTGEYLWKIDANSYMYSVGPTIQAQLALGTHTVSLGMENELGGVGAKTATVNVVDTTAPSIDVGSVSTVPVCDIQGEGIKIPLPKVNDACTGVASVTGKVISRNGVSLDSPIELVDGAAHLPVGNFEVLWQASDKTGNISEARQSISVVPAIYSLTNTVINDYGKVRTLNGTGSVIANGSGGQVEIKFAGEVGEIVSLSPVILRNQAKVYGDVWSTSSIEVNSGASAAAYYRNAEVVLPPPVWPSVSMPNGGSEFITKPGENQLMVPGAYSNVAVQPNTTMRIVSEGLYSIQSLSVETGATLDLSGITGDVTIVAGYWFAFRGHLIPPTASTARVTLVYLGTGASFIESAFPADVQVYAPNGRVVVGQAGGQLFLGALTAKEIEIANRATVICRVN